MQGGEDVRICAVGVGVGVMWPESAVGVVVVVVVGVMGPESAHTQLPWERASRKPP